MTSITLNDNVDLANFIKKYTYNETTQLFVRDSNSISLNNITISNSINTSINLSSQGIKNVNINTFIPLISKITNTLTSLVLSFNNIGDEGASALANNLPNTLQDLYLSSNNIGYEGASALANKLPNTLTYLYLSSNNIGDEGASALANKLPNTLQALYLSSNNIGDEGAEAIISNLSRLTSLSELYLKYNNISKPIINKLKEYLDGRANINYYIETQNHTLLIIIILVSVLLGIGLITGIILFIRHKLIMK